jgi:hypothetical protein
MKILLEWMLEEGNYARFRGKNNNGVTKLQIASMLADKMKNETTSSDRNSKQVLDRIKRLEDSFRSAHEFANSVTGAGIQERQGEQTFKDVVRKKCSYYYEMVDVMADRSGTAPRLTNIDLDFFTDDEDQEAEEEEEEQEDRQEAVDATAVVYESASVASSRASVGTGRKAKRRKSNPLVANDPIAILETANERSQEKIREMSRHHSKMESIEEEKLELERQKMQTMEWKGKRDELNYKVDLVKQYKELKTSGISDEQIAQLFPEMKLVMEALKDKS